MEHQETTIESTEVVELVLNTLQSETKAFLDSKNLATFLEMCDKKSPTDRLNVPSRKDALLDTVADRLRDGELIRTTLNDFDGQVSADFLQISRERLGHLVQQLNDTKSSVITHFDAFIAATARREQERDDLFGDIEKERRRREIADTIQAQSMVERQQDDQLDLLQPTLTNIKEGHEQIGTMLQDQIDEMELFGDEVNRTRTNMDKVTRTVTTVLKHVKKSKEAVIIIVLVLINILMLLLNVYGV